MKWPWALWIFALLWAETWNNLWENCRPWISYEKSCLKMSFALCPSLSKTKTVIFATPIFFFVEWKQLYIKSNRIEWHVKRVAYMLHVFIVAGPFHKDIQLERQVTLVKSERTLQTNGQHFFHYKATERPARLVLD